MTNAARQIMMNRLAKINKEEYVEKGKKLIESAESKTVK
jgi:hypothetical protein